VIRCRFLSETGEHMKMPVPNLSVLNFRARLRLLISCTAASVFAVLAIERAAAEEPQISTNVLTYIGQFWHIPAEEKHQVHRIRTEILIYYCDPQWTVSWGECDGEPAYLPFRGLPVQLEPGQRVRIDGFMHPSDEKFLWDKTTIEILESNVVITATPITNLSDNATELKSKLVSVEGLVDRILPGDPTHTMVNFLVNGTMASLFIRNLTNAPPLQMNEGDYVRIKAVYAPQFDRNGKLNQLSLWVAKPEDVKKIGSLENDSRFETPVTQIEKIGNDMPMDLLHVEGVVRSHEPGKSVTLWGDTGQIVVRSGQTSPLRFGDHVEAIGYPYMSGIEQCLEQGLYRSMPTNHITISSETKGNKSVFYLAEEIRDLTRERAREHPQARLRGVLTWGNRHTPFIYVQDASGGIRVANPKWLGEVSYTAGTIVTLNGQIIEGDFVPVVTNAILARDGWWNLQEAREVPYDHAMTGLEDCHWIQMRGYVRSVTNVNGLVALDLSTPSGEFRAWTLNSGSFDYLKGAVVRVQGVCDAIADAKHRLTGIQLWVPEVKYINTEELAPGDLFAVPLRSMDSLRQFNLQNALNQRVRVRGTVVLHAPGRYLYVQDNDASIYALTDQRDELTPGDQVEVVGLAGTQGKKFLLREAVYHRSGPGIEPPPVQLPETHLVNADLGGLLASATGTLLNLVTKEGEAKLLIQTRDSAFEASLFSPSSDGPNNPTPLEIGSQLRLTGVYEIQSDDYGKPRAFVLRLRSWKDISVLRNPPWWTLKKLLWLLLGFGGVSAVVLSWALVMSRKNTLLHHTQTALQQANDGLEARVLERTKELEHQVAAKERARAELAEAQKSLMLASRKAGMAEVATGVLHNVGNVLNSVNVSALLLADRIRNSRVENVTKAGALLQQQDGELANFLGSDPKGKQLPTYLKKLGESLVAEKQELEGEIQSLVKSVDHIKVIVGMQQNYAKLGGIVEELNLEEVVEDAIRINSAALDRHGIHVVKNYQPLPPLVTDRHKILQIVVNLLSNSKRALQEKAEDKKIIITLAAVQPDRVSLSVEDNGIGIPAESISKIFSQGFTTRKDGHGFGLHSGANTAKELGGSLVAQSAGLGKGARFILELPIMSAGKNQLDGRTGAGATN
jgi:signal transduction histidine kinase